MNAGTAGAVRNACVKVLESYEYWAKIDLLFFDVDKAIERFRGRAHGELAEGTIDQYDRYFREAVLSFLWYIDDPGTWQPPIPRRQSSSRRSDRSNPIPEVSEMPVDRSALTASRSRMTISLPTHPRAVYLELPAGLTKVEADFLLRAIPLYVNAAMNSVEPG